MEVKMKSVKTVFCTLTVLALLFAVLAVSACGQKKGGQPSLEGVTQSITFTGYPIDTKGETISWFNNRMGYWPNEQYATANDSPFHSGLAEMLGVKIDWQFPVVGTAGNQALNLALASRDVPNIIYAGGLMSQADLLIDEGAIYDLTPYLEKWSQAYWKLLQSNPEYNRAMKTDSGKYYGYGFFREDGGWNDTYLGPVVNKTWLDELGLPVPKTISDWDRTLRAFKERYGATLSFSWSRVISPGSAISGAFGAYSFADHRLYVDENGKVRHANTQPEYRKQLEQFAIWWQDGIIDQDILSINDTMVRTNALNKKVGLSITSMGQLSSWIQDAEGSGSDAEWIGIEYPTGDDGTLVQVPGGLGIGAGVGVISTSVKPEQLELAMRMLDYGYTDEGSLYWNFGKQGLSWDYGADGKPAFLPLLTEDPSGLSASVDKYAGSVWNGNCVQATIMIYMKNTPEAIAANDLWYWPNEEITASNKIPSGMSLTSEESIRSGELSSAISTYVSESTVQFFTGQASFDTWDAYVARVNALGIEELLSIQQAAYDRYMAR